MMCRRTVASPLILKQLPADRKLVPQAPIVGELGEKVARHCPDLHLRRRFLGALKQARLCRKQVFVELFSGSGRVAQRLRVRRFGLGDQAHVATSARRGVGEMVVSGAVIVRSL